MSEWTKEQLEEMFGDDVVEQLSFLSGCTKHSYSDPKNPELNGFIISHDSLYKFAELIVKECAEAVKNSIWHLPRGYKAEDQAEFVKKHFGVE